MLLVVSCLLFGPLDIRFIGLGFRVLPPTANCQLLTMWFWGSWSHLVTPQTIRLISFRLSHMSLLGITQRCFDKLSMTIRHIQVGQGSQVLSRKPIVLHSLLSASAAPSAFGSPRRGRSSSSISYHLSKTPRRHISCAPLLHS